MKASYEIVFNVQLTEAEARYIRDLTQNYLGKSPQEETLEQQNIRQELFIKFKEVLDYRMPLRIGEGIR